MHIASLVYEVFGIRIMLYELHKEDPGKIPGRNIYSPGLR